MRAARRRMARFPESAECPERAIGSSCPVPLGETLQRVNVMAVGEGEEGFGRIGAVSEVGAEQLFNGLWAIFALDVAPQLAGDLGIVARAAADQDVEAFRRIALFVERHLGAYE